MVLLILNIGFSHIFNIKRTMIILMAISRVTVTFQSTRWINSERPLSESKLWLELLTLVLFSDQIGIARRATPVHIRHCHSLIYSLKN